MGPPASELTVDHLFSLYRASGRPRHLAEVFDRTAPELLRVASHLTRDPATAEDLVQGTFVEAIRSARRFTPGRRVLPWLSGILANLAREAQRREHRHPEDVAGSPASPVDPAEAAQDAELRAAIDDQLEELDEPYRTVLLLHLRHDLSPAEIARVVSRSPATVRSQLARGRDRLRERLPRSYANGIALGLLSGRGLEGVRAAVLRRAYLAAPRLLASGGLELLAGRRIASVTVVTAVLLTTALLRHELRNEAPTRSTPSPPAGGAAQTASAGVGVPHVPPAASERVQAVPARAPTHGHVPTARLEVHVRWDQQPLPDAGVRLRPDEGGDLAFSERRARTDAQGRVAFEGLAPGAFRVELDRARGPRIELVAGADERVHLHLDRTNDLTGRVLDADGRPIHGAQLWTAFEGRAAFGMRAGQSGPDGRFHLRGVHPDFFVAAFAAGRRPSALAPHGHDEIELVLDGAGLTVEGRVIDERGEPIPDALVRFGYESPPFELVNPEGGPLRSVTNQALRDLRTGPDGRYRFESVPPGTTRLFVRARGRVGEQSTVSVGPGPVTRHDVVLRRGGDLAGRVHRGGDPLVDGHVFARTPQHGEPSWFTPWARTSAGGGYTLQGLAPGPHRVRVYAGAGSTEVPIRVVRDECTRLDVDLAGTASIRGVAVDERGQPRAGLLVRGRRDETLRARTDARGHFQLMAEPGTTGDLELLDTDAPVPARVGVVHGARADSAGHIVRVEVNGTASAFLSGHLLPDDGTALANARLRIRQPGQPLWTELTVVSTEGRFRIGPLIPGPYEVLALAAGRVVRRLGEHALARGEQLDLGPVTLARGGTLAFRITEQGRAHADPVHLCIRDAGGELLYERALVEPQASTLPLPAGTAEVCLWSANLPILRCTPTVVAGEHRVVPLTVPAHAPHRLVLEGASAATPPQETHARVIWIEDGREIAHDDHGSFGPHGLILERPLLPGPYTARVVTGSGRSGETSFVVHGHGPQETRVSLSD